MTPNSITIKELKFELEIDEKSDFENVALNISELSNKNLIISLQKDFDAAFKSDENVCINSIVIDIGVIDFSNKSSITETISALLLNKIKSLDTNDYKSNESLIIHFVKFGFLPWWASSPKKMNDFLSKTSFNQNLKDELYQIITKDSSNFYRLLNVLNTKNKNKFLKKYLKNKFSYFQNSTSFFEKLLENFYNSESSKNRFNIKHELFIALLKHDKENDFVFFMVLKKIIHNSNIQWAKVSETLSLKNNDNKKFSETLNFNEQLFYSNNRLLNSELSEIGHLKYYIINGAKDTSGVLNVDNLIVILSRLLSHDIESLKIIFSQLDVYNNPVKLFRVSKLLNINNLYNFISLLFNSSKTRFLENSFRFLKSIDEKGKINTASYFDFIYILLNLKNSRETSNHLFYESLIKAISKTYNLRYNEVLIEFYYFSNSYKNTGEFEEVIEIFYKNTVLKDTIELDFFMNQFKKSNKPIYISFLSKYQIKQFNLIKKHILYLNQHIVFNDWSNYTTESFIFNQLSKQTIGSKNTFVKIIETYSKKYNADSHNLIIAILIKFFPKKTAPEGQSIELLEYVLSINKPHIVHKFSIKEQQYLIALLSDPKIEEKLELLSYNFNLKLSLTESHSNFDYVQNVEIKDSFIKQKIVHLIKEYSAIFNGAVKSKLTRNQLTQILKLEIEKNSINNKRIVYERVLNSIANISNVNITALAIQLLKRLVNKNNFNTYDLELLNQINDSFFAFNSIFKTTERNTNYFYELLNNINADSIKRVVLNDYLLKSKIAVLKLNDKNYESLMKNLAFSNNNNFIVILNNLLSYLSYRKRIEFSSTLKLTALIIANKKNLTDEEFLLELLEKLNSMDSITYLKIKEQLYITIKKFNDEVDTLSKIDVTRNAVTPLIQELKQKLLEKERDYKLLELEALKLSEHEKNQAQKLIESDYKIALKKVLAKNDFIAKASFTGEIQELKKRVLEKERDYKLLELEALKLSAHEKNQAQKLIESDCKIALKKVLAKNKYIDKAFVIQLIQELKQKLLEKERDYKLLELEALKLSEREKNQAQKLIESDYKIALKKIVAKNDFIEKASVIQLIQELKKKLLEKERDYELLEVVALDITENEEIQQQKLIETNYKIELKKIVAENDFSEKASGTKLIQELKKKLLEKERDYELLEVRALKITENEKIQQQKLIEANYKIALKKVVAKNDFIEKASVIQLIQELKKKLLEKERDYELLEVRALKITENEKIQQQKLIEANYKIALKKIVAENDFSEKASGTKLIQELKQKLLEKERDYKLLEVRALKITENEKIQQQKLIETNYKIALKRIAIENKYTDKASVTAQIQELKKKLLEKERDYKLLEVRALKITENEKIQQQKLIETNYKIALKKLVAENDFSEKGSVNKLIQELKKKLLEKERDYKLLELVAIDIAENEEIQQQKLIETNYKIALKKLATENKYTNKASVTAQIQELKKKLLEKERDYKLLEVRALKITENEKIQQQKLIETNHKIALKKIVAENDFSEKASVTQLIQELKKKLLDKERDYKLLEVTALDITENEEIQQQKLIEANYKIALKKLVAENDFTNKASVTQLIQELKKKLLEKERDYKLLKVVALDITKNEEIQQQKLIEANYKIALKKLVAESDFTDEKENIATIESLEEYEHQSISLANSKDIILKTVSSYFNMPSQKYINTLSDKDFDYFLNLKKQINTSKTPKFLNFESYRNIEDIIKSNKNFLEFLNLYIDDFELLFEFAQASFSNPIKNHLASLIGSKNDTLVKVENYFLKLQKKTLFSTLNTTEFKTLIRVNIIKTLVFTVHYKNQLNISAFTMDFIETLSKNQKINYKQTATIGLKYLAKTTLEKQIIKGIVSFFDSNNFEPINKKIKEDELLKNIIHSFLITKKIPAWSSYQSFNIEDVITFIKIKIKKSDSKYIKEILLNNKTAPIIISKLKKEGSDTQLEVLKLLEPSIEKSFSISDFFESIIRINSCSDFEMSLIFEHILVKKLWQKPSLLYVFDEVYSLLKKHNIHKKTNIIENLQLKYPNLKLITKPIIQISSEQKIELIRFYIQHGSLANIYGNNSSVYLQLLKAYSSKNKNQLKILLLEFSNTPEVSRNFISVSSKAILENLIIDELNNKNIELRFVFEKRIKSISTQIKDDIILFDLLINNIIAPKIIKLSNLDIVLKTIKSLNHKDYTSIIKTAQKLVSDGKMIEKNGVVRSYLKSIEKTNLSKDSDNKQITFNNFIKDLRYFIEFKSLNRSKEIIQINKLYLFVLQFKSNLILKKQLHNWSKQKDKILTLFKLFSKKEVTMLINCIHPNQLDCINNFNSILSIISYKPLQDYLNLDSSYKLTFKVLNTWSKQSIIINEPSEILFLLFEEILAHPSIDSAELMEKLQNIHPSLNLSQKALVSSLLKTSMNSVDEITEIASDDLVSNELKDSIYVNNAGMIIIWPFLSTLCSKLGLLDGKEFIDDYSLQKAVLMLHYIGFGDEKFEESNLVLNKILCGASPDFFVDTSLRLNEMDKSIGEQMLIAVTKNWEKLGNTSPTGLRESFLKRDGIVKKNENNYTLIVEAKPFDMLLKTIPWNIMMIQTSFMDIRLLVEWKI
jgi:hypothetical protein